MKEEIAFLDIGGCSDEEEEAAEESQDSAMPQRLTSGLKSGRLKEWYCSHHKNKFIEAYCFNDAQPLCIECILTNQHKDHRILSIE